MVTKKNWLLGVIALFLTGNLALGQSVANYIFQASSSTYIGTTSQTQIHGAIVDDAISGNLNIGFDFWYNGIRYTQFRASSNGYIVLGTAGADNNANNLNTSTNNIKRLIAPLWDDIETDNSASQKYCNYVLTGVAPNRVITVEWHRQRWQFNSSDDVISFQCKLYETTNLIEFNYSQGANAASSGSASIGINSNSNNQYLSLNNSGASPAASSSTSTTNIASKPSTDQLYRFSPHTSSSNILLAPTSAACSALSTQINLSWADNATNELGYEVYYSTNPNVPLDATNSVRIALGANSTSTLITGLSPTTTYYFKIFARKEGLSTALTTLCTTPDYEYQTAWVSMDTGSANWCAGETRTVSVTVTNSGSQAWIDGGSDDFNIGIKWNAEPDYIVRVDAQNLAAGATQTYNLTVTAPATTGSNNLTFDVVREQCFWFANNATACGVTAGPGNTFFASSAITIIASPGAVTVTPTTSTICANGSPVLLSVSGGSGGSGSASSVNNSSGTINLAIPDNSAAGVTNSLNISSIPSNATITQIDVTFTLNHAFLKDAEVVLLAPNGKRIALAADQGPNGTGLYNNVVITSNTSAGVLATASSPITGTYRANANLTGLKGGNFSNTLTSVFSELFTTPNGNWVLGAYDDANNDLGTFNSWSISITYSTPDLIWSPTAGLDPDGNGPAAPYSGGSANALYGFPSTTQTYTITATGSNGCTSTATTTINVNPVLNASVAIAITSGSNPSCLGNSVTFTATPTNGGAGPIYQWTKNGSDISGATSSTYTGIAGTDFISTDAIRCVITSNATPCLVGSPATSAPITMNVVSAAPANVGGTYTSGVINHTDGTTQIYNYDNCITIGEITDAAGGNVLGNTTMSATIAASINTSNPEGYVYGRRSYSVAPSSDGAATLKLYFTQADFDNYNANAAGFLSLPTSGDNSDPNKQFFRITTLVGGVYSMSGPLGANLNWNGTNWEFTLPVTTMTGAVYYFATMPSCNGIAVNNLAATNVTTDAVTATWTSVVTTPTWGWYSLQYRVVGAPAWTDAGTANNSATSAFRNGLVPGTNYEMQIRRHCSGQSTGPWSASVFFTTLGGGCSSPMVLNTPTVTTTTTATTTWTAISGAAWYEFQYKEASSGTWISAGTLAGTATSKLFTGLTAGTAYNFRGRTYCSSGTQSPWSVIANATTSSTASGCSLPPVLAATTVNASNITLSWTAVSGAAYYEFRYSAVSATGPWTSGGTLGGASTSKSFTGLTQNTTYYFEARTYCSNGIPSAWGALQATTTTPTGCQLPPVLTATTVLATTATITWPAVAGASWYEFRYKPTASGTWLTAGTLPGTGTTKTLTGLTAGTQYDFQARTFCSNGLANAWSTTLQFTTAMAMPLQPKPGSDLANDKVLENTNIDVNVYPNPTSALVNIETIFEEADAAILVKVIDMNGRIVLEMNTLSVEGKNAIQLSLENLNVGIYNLELYNNNELIDRSKVIKTN